MWAVLGWCNGFGNDTYVAAIFQSENKARAWAKAHVCPCKTWRFQEFQFGEVDFEWYEAEK